MGKIRLLGDSLANRIAAGEVVERPASVVKELIENAVDAGSRDIRIEVEEGGLKKIKVDDDGAGMEEDDAELAFSRHATSKIRSERDLFRIGTLGFRGEALPSIASVSHLELRTGTGEGPGTQMRLESGKIVEKKATAARKGTEVTVTNLFYNTPARLKHLKTVHTELGNVLDVVNRAALADPDIAFSFFHNGRKTFQTSGNGDLLRAIAAVYTTSVARQMIQLQNESIDFRLTGYISKPELTRASRQYLSVFLNGRYIKNYSLYKAMIEGYRTLLPVGRYPVAVIHIETDVSLVDVNVHPAKLQARVSKEKELCKLLENSVKRVLTQADLMYQPSAKKRRPTKEVLQQTEFSFQYPNVVGKKNESNESQDQKASERDDASPEKSETKFERHSAAKQDDFIRELTHNEQKSNKTDKQFKVSEERRNMRSKEENNVAERLPVLYPIGQLHGTYILAQNEKGLYIIDQHAAQERIKYEYYRAQLARPDRRLQELLVPLTLEFSQGETEKLKDRMEQLQEAGLFLEAFGPHSFIVSAHPVWFPRGFEKETIRELVTYVLENETTDPEKWHHDAAALMACKRSIKANHYLRQEEMFSLLETLRKADDPYTCPHGRPVIVHFTQHELEKMFKRVM